MTTIGQDIYNLKKYFFKKWRIFLEISSTYAGHITAVKSPFNFNHIDGVTDLIDKVLNFHYFNKLTPPGAQSRARAGSCIAPCAEKIHSPEKNQFQTEFIFYTAK